MPRVWRHFSDLHTNSVSRSVCPACNSAATKIKAAYKGWRTRMLVWHYLQMCSVRGFRTANPCIHTFVVTSFSRGRTRERPSSSSRREEPSAWDQAYAASAEPTENPQDEDVQFQNWQRREQWRQVELERRQRVAAAPPNVEQPDAPMQDEPYDYEAERLAILAYALMMSITVDPSQDPRINE